MKTNQTNAVTSAIPELPFDETQNALVQIRDGVPMTSSLQVAQYFGKRHNDVLRDIRAIECSNDFHKRNFASLFYIREIGNGAQRKFPLVYMTKDGFTFLVMGFTGKVAAKFKEDYINAFNSMEYKLKTEAVPKTQLEAACRQIKQLQKAVDTLKAQQSTPNQSLRPAKSYYLTDDYYNHLVRAFVDWLVCENLGCYLPDIRDTKLLKRIDAARTLYYDRNITVPINVALSQRVNL